MDTTKFTSKVHLGLLCVQERSAAASVCSFMRRVKTWVYCIASGPLVMGSLGSPENGVEVG